MHECIPNETTHSVKTLMETHEDAIKTSMDLHPYFRRILAITMIRNDINGTSFDMSSYL